jgi:hypothetical protein
MVRAAVTTLLLLLLAVTHGVGHAFGSQALGIPTDAQVQWASDGYGAFIHFNMGTYVSDGGGCNVQDMRKDKRQAQGLDPNLFNPTSLDTDQWVRLIASYGGKYAVLTAKHNCGFLLYPSNTTLPDGTRFNYSVAQSQWAGGQGDVVASFVASCHKYNITPGVYFSLASSAVFDVGGNQVLKSRLVPGQIRVTQAQYEAINLAQLEELWSTYVTWMFLLAARTHSLSPIRLAAIGPPTPTHSHPHPHHTHTHTLSRSGENVVATLQGTVQTVQYSTVYSTVRAARPTAHRTLPLSCPTSPRRP